MFQYNQLRLLLFCVLISIVNSVNWYDTKVLYQIYPKSFKDSDGDGFGDLKGIASKVEHFTDIGVQAVWLSPIFKSPMKDNGYDISNYTDIDQIFGTMYDMKALIDTFHSLGIKILLDLVPNHTSEDHPWFKDSIERKNGKDDYYVWADGSTKDSSGNWLPPNNWLSLSGDSAWTFNEKRNQFYLHQFGSYQPDLNFTNPKVVDELKDVVRFWMDKGIDGFRVDAVPYLVEDINLTPEIEIANCHSSNRYDCFIHNMTKDTPGTFKVLNDIGSVLDEVKYKDIPRKLFLEAYTDLNTTMKYFTTNAIPFNFQLLQFQRDWNASQIENLINNWMETVPASTENATYTNIWVIGNHDNSRVGTRMGEDMIDAMNMLVFMTPGNTVTYYGEEIGMLDGYIKPSIKKDDRDPERTPMQWKNILNAAFSNSSNTWLPVNPNYWRINKETEAAEKNSHLSIYKELIKLQDEIISSSNYSTHVISPWIFILRRQSYMLVMNLDDRDDKFNLTEIGNIPSTLTVKIASLNAGHNDGDSLKVDELYLRPRSAIIFHTGSAVMNTVSILLLFTLLMFHF